MLHDRAVGTVSGLPGLDGLFGHIEKWRGARALVVSTAGADGRALGNNGDDLMHAVFRRILEELSVEIVDESPDVLFVPPSGGLLETYSFPRHLRDRLAQHPSVPVVVFPSSAYFPTKDPGWVFEGRGAPTLLIARERGSKEHLESQWGSSLRGVGVTVVLDHDVVASGHKFVPGILGVTRRKAISMLIAARIDREARPMTLSSDQHAEPTQFTPSMLRQLMDLVPYGRARTTLGRVARRRRNRRAAEDLASRAGVTLGRAMAVDVSARQFATFDQYRESILRSDMVVTNRLHVALPAAIVGKSVVMVEAGYFKLTGVYDQSLAAVPNVRMISDVR